MATKLRTRLRRLRQYRPCPVWQDDDDLDNLAFDPPRAEMAAARDCPVGMACQGCGAVDGLRVATSVFSGPDGYTAACATVCPRCAGRSFLYLLTDWELQRAFDAHSTHLPGD
jgi:ferredoxin